LQLFALVLQGQVLLRRALHLGAISQLSFLQRINPSSEIRDAAVEPSDCSELCGIERPRIDERFNEGFIHEKLASAFLLTIGIHSNACYWLACAFIIMVGV
jgi:hypothetical protein